MYLPLTYTGAYFAGWPVVRTPNGPLGISSRGSDSVMVVVLPAVIVTFLGHILAAGLGELDLVLASRNGVRAGEAEIAGGAEVFSIQQYTSAARRLGLALTLRLPVR